MQGILVDTTPMNSFKPDILNLGYEIVAEKWGLRRVHWRDEVDLADVKYICFNVTYPLYILNVVPFLRLNGIAPLVRAREKAGHPEVIVGGSGVSNLCGCLDEIADVVFRGELDGENAPNSPDTREWDGKPKFRSVLNTPIVKITIDGKPTAVIELTRGCPHRCAFCEYSWSIGGPYREKQPQLVINQLDDLLAQYPSLRRKGLTMRTSSLGSYRYLPEVAEALCERNMSLRWADLNPQDFLKVYHFIKPLGITRLHLGIESFTEDVRKSTGKRFGDDELAMILRLAMQSCSYLHINLIFGLPGESDYAAWFAWVRRIDSIRKRIPHKLRIDFIITNFEPSCGTPWQDTSTVDFDLKDNYFLPAWIALLTELGFYSLGKRQKIWYGSDFGRHGRKRLAHELIMTLRHGGTKLTRAICEAFPSGVRRYVTDKQALKFHQYSRLP